jgi:hypothetical protein
MSVPDRSPGALVHSERLSTAPLWWRCGLTLPALERCPGGLIRLIALLLNVGLWLAALKAGRHFGFWQ